MQNFGASSRASRSLDVHQRLQARPKHSQEFAAMVNPTAGIRDREKRSFPTRLRDRTLDVLLDRAHQAHDCHWLQIANAAAQRGLSCFTRSPALRRLQFVHRTPAKIDEEAACVLERGQEILFGDR